LKSKNKQLKYDNENLNSENQDLSSNLSKLSVEVKKLQGERENMKSSLSKEIGMFKDQSSHKISDLEDRLREVSEELIVYKQ